MKRETRIIVAQTRDTGQGGAATRTNVGHAEVLPNGEIELHFNGSHLDGSHRLLIETEEEGDVVYCACGLAIYDDAAKAGSCLDCQRRADIISAGKRRAVRR